MGGGGGGGDDNALEQQPAAAISTFQPRVPPPRVARRGADGRLMLDFAGEPERQRFRRACVASVAANCSDGARAACCVRAMDACRGPAWLRWLGWRPRRPWAEVDACEEAHVEACMLPASKACQQHAEEFCGAVVDRQQRQ